jgi:hypothetical protein
MMFSALEVRAAAAVFSALGREIAPSLPVFSLPAF